MKQFSMKKASFEIFHFIMEVVILSCHFSCKNLPLKGDDHDGEVLKQPIRLSAPSSFDRDLMPIDLSIVTCLFTYLPLLRIGGYLVQCQHSYGSPTRTFLHIVTLYNLLELALEGKRIAQLPLRKAIIIAKNEQRLGNGKESPDRGRCGYK